MNIRPLIAFILATLLGALSPLASAQVAISPPLADISLDAPAQTHAFRIMNDSHDPMQVAVTVVNWTMDEHGKVTPIPNTAQSLAPWVQINPVEFTIPPGQSQVVRYAIRPAVKLEPGEHRAMVFFTQQPIAGSKPEPASLHVYFRLGAAIYGHVGPVDARGAIVSLRPTAKTLTFVLQNTGNATTRMLGQYALWSAAAYPGAAAALDNAQLQDNYHAPHGLLACGALPRDAVLPGARRIVNLPIKQSLPPGRYVLQLAGKLGATDIGRVLHFDVAAARR